MKNVRSEYSLLSILQQPLTTLPKVGEKMSATLARLGCKTIWDLLCHLPVQVHYKQAQPSLTHVTSGTDIITTITITALDPPPLYGKLSRKKPFRIYGENATGYLTLVYFNYHPSYLLKQFTVGSVVTVSGKVEWYGEQLCMAHPEKLVVGSTATALPTFHVVYPLTYGLVQPQLCHFIATALLRLPPTTAEWIPATRMQAHSWPSFIEALKKIHNIQTQEEISPLNPARMRLAYDELLAQQLGLRCMRGQQSGAARTPLSFQGTLQQQLKNIVPFQLTEGQLHTLTEIAEDQRSPQRMVRLLLGDVGSGKTMVALGAILNSVEAGFQAALMVPTDILSNQHYATITRYAEPLGIRVGLLTGRAGSREKKKVYQQLHEHQLDIVVGTHALFQEEVAFAKLGLVVIDEQHRFGVAQRLLLTQKGQEPDLLVMTATPIPRTLTLALYGDMAVSRLLDKPKGRIPITTSVVSHQKIPALIDSIHNAIQGGNKVYWVCPLIEEQEESEEATSSPQKPLTAATTRYQELLSHFPGKVGLIHGQLKSAEKDAIMHSFAHGPLSILVATTVIEVGIDVPDANIIVIEHAERFGLSQLHQLRGRVGRGTKPSYCMLLYHPPLGAIAKARLQVMRESTDGFHIAEEDLRLRGSGDVLGTKQSGLPAFRFADLTVHSGLLQEAYEDAKKLMLEDPHFSSPTGILLQQLLELYDFHHYGKARYAG